MWVLHPTDISVDVTKEEAKELLIDRTAENWLGWDQCIALCPPVVELGIKKNSMKRAQSNSIFVDSLHF